MVAKQRNDPVKYADDEVVARREAALKRMLSTPPKRHKPLGKRGAKRAKSIAKRKAADKRA